MKKIILLTLVTGLVTVALLGCGNPKYRLKSIGLCEMPRSSLQEIPYTNISQANCVVAIRPFDLSLWHQAPMNSYKRRGARTAELGCQPLTPAVDNCSYCGPAGFSTTLMINFDPTVYASASQVQRAVLAVYSPSQARDLKGAYLRGRLNIGESLTSLARQRTVVPDTGPPGGGGGWVLFDVTFFVARAINERRNSIHFEVAFPCQTPAANQVVVGVNFKEPRLLVEFK